MYRMTGVLEYFVCFILISDGILCNSDVWSIGKKRNAPNSEESLKNEALIHNENYVTNRKSLYGNLTKDCATDEYQCDNKCILRKYLCDGAADCKDGRDEKGCPIKERRKKWRTTLIEACTIVAILLLLTVLILTYCWFNRKQEGDVDILSMARHRGMSIAQISTKDGGGGNKSDPFWNEDEIEEPTIITGRSRGKSIVNPRYEDEGFRNVDLEVDMFDDGEKLPDHTIRRSSSIANPSYSRKVLPEITLTNTIKETTTVCDNEKMFSIESLDNINPLNENSTPPRSSSFTNPLYDDDAWQC